jgi:hypothetical protein
LTSASVVSFSSFCRCNIAFDVDEGRSQRMNPSLMTPSYVDPVDVRSFGGFHCPIKIEFTKSVALDMASNNAQRAGMRVQGRISHLKAMAFPQPEITCGFRARIHRAQQIVDVDSTCFTWRQEQIVSEDIVRAALESILRKMTNCSPYMLM